ncbi:hypothetical protein PMAYCL1PPCAC_26656, partial [Pristionchus mayeri]
APSDRFDWHGNSATLLYTLILSHVRLLRRFNFIHVRVRRCTLLHHHRHAILRNQCRRSRQPNTASDHATLQRTVSGRGNCRRILLHAWRNRLHYIGDRKRHGKSFTDDSYRPVRSWNCVHSSFHLRYSLIYRHQGPLVLSSTCFLKSCCPTSIHFIQCEHV